MGLPVEFVFTMNLETPYKKPHSVRFPRCKMRKSHAMELVIVAKRRAIIIIRVSANVLLIVVHALIKITMPATPECNASIWRMYFPVKCQKPPLSKELVLLNRGIRIPIVRNVDLEGLIERTNVVISTMPQLPITLLTVFKLLTWKLKLSS